MVKRTYLLNNKKQLNIDFYNGFEPDFLFRKADLLQFIINNTEAFASFVTQITGESRHEDLNDKFYSPLKAEIHFTSLHQTEALFALLYASIQPLPHWLYLTTYATTDIKEIVRKYIDGEISELTEGKLITREQFVAHTVYMGCHPNEIPEGKSWDQNLSNIAWFLKLLGDRFINGDEYNAYKHGIRVFVGGSSISIMKDGQPDSTGLKFSTEDSITYLQIHNERDGTSSVHQVTKFFKPQEGFEFLGMMTQLLTTIKNTRLGSLTGKHEGPICVWYDLDRTEICQLREITKWTISL